MLYHILLPNFFLTLQCMLAYDSCCAASLNMSIRILLLVMFKACTVNGILPPAVCAKLRVTLVVVCVMSLIPAVT